MGSQNSESPGPQVAFFLQLGLCCPVCTSREAKVAYGMPSFQRCDNPTELQRNGKSVMQYQPGGVCSDTQSLTGVPWTQGENIQKRQNVCVYTSHEIIVDVDPLRTEVLSLTHSQNPVICTLVTTIWLIYFSSIKRKMLRHAVEKQITTNGRAKLYLAILPVTLGGGCWSQNGSRERSWELP